MTTRQMATIKDVLENKMPVSVAMRKNGYTKESARSLKIKDTEAWRQVVEQYLPDYKLFKVHQDALDANKLHGTTDDYVEIPDHQTRLKAVELGYRLKGKMSDNVRQTMNQVNISWDNGGYSSSISTSQQPKQLKRKA